MGSCRYCGVHISPSHLLCNAHYSLLPNRIRGGLKLAMINKDKKRVGEMMNIAVTYLKGVERG